MLRGPSPKTLLNSRFKQFFEFLKGLFRMFPKLVAFDRSNVRLDKVEISEKAAAASAQRRPPNLGPRRTRSATPIFWPLKPHTLWSDTL